MTVEHIVSEGKVKEFLQYEIGKVATDGSYGAFALSNILERFHSLMSSPEIFEEMREKFMEPCRVHYGEWIDKDRESESSDGGMPDATALKPEGSDSPCVVCGDEARAFICSDCKQKFIADSTPVVTPGD